ncbi:Protein RALF-like 18 [Cardamine amara subsp. amara]|uniref:Protein RALF-like 18 n=1 Tax=Cardamine amara subsp. amara TaxID=228776 RepID=A0ABD1AS89_CARAN
MMNYMKLLILAVIISAALSPGLVRSRPVKCENCINGGEEEIMKMRSSMDVSRRILRAPRHISYEALKNDKLAKRDGKPDLPDNTYRRTCTFATNCLRFTD